MGKKKEKTEVRPRIAAGPIETLVDPEKVEFLGFVKCPSYRGSTEEVFLELDGVELRPSVPWTKKNFYDFKAMGDIRQRNHLLEKAGLYIALSRAVMRGSKEKPDIYGDLYREKLDGKRK